MTDLKDSMSASNFASNLGKMIQKPSNVMCFGEQTMGRGRVFERFSKFKSMSPLLKMADAQNYIDKQNWKMWINWRNLSMKTEESLSVMLQTH
jgi:hypothetical protein